jgi:PDZ domain-containing protein
MSPRRDRPAPAPRRLRALMVRIGLVAVLVAVGLAWHPPIYIVSPGPVTDIAHDMTITGIASRVPQGRYLLVTVEANQHCLFGDLLASFHAHRQVITTSEVGSLGAQYNTFDESQVLAAAAAGRADGLTITLGGDGAEVTGVTAGSALSVGDLILSIDGAAVHTEFDVQHAIAADPVGTRFTLSVRRGAKNITVTATSARSKPGSGETASIGAVLATRNLAITSPFTITFRHRSIGGPSAGLVYALTISDMLGTIKLAPGHSVAATGTLDAQGNVGDVGDVDLKALGAAAAGARLFIVPADEVSQAKGLIHSVQGATSLSHALQIVRTQG